MKSDSQIAYEAKKKPITEIAQELGIREDELNCYGRYKAKLTAELRDRLSDHPDGKLILVTAINPTPAGEGKTTTTVGLGQAMALIGKKAIIALREPSLGPVFGVKGGAAGGGYSQVVPMEDINLHFTGDFHAVTSANNLLAAMLDNHIHHGNALNIDPRRIVFYRAMDMNDRALRNTVIGLGGTSNGFVREDGFMITVASEIMAILCLAGSLSEMKTMLGNILVAYTYEGKPVFARDLHANGAMAALLKEASDPNLVQTTENTPCIIHGGPFANIAHGCNSIIATRTALKLADYCITEAGFGADLGAEKFFDIKCRKAHLSPDAVVLVATVRALKYNGGLPKNELKAENMKALADGICNLGSHIDNIRSFGLPVAVAINRFDTDTDREVEFVAEYCRKKGVEAVVSTAFCDGGRGAAKLAETVTQLCETEKHFTMTYSDDMTLYEKAQAVCKKIYHAEKAEFLPRALTALESIEAQGFGSLPVCIAKTQYSLSDDPSKLGAPEHHTVTVRDARVSAGAGFVVLLTGSILTMPGLPSHPAAENIDIDENGVISGLF
ncbi:MAG TPA: formate--tetrahydrofolate ligase [Bacillota bacterium]|nr:formate--tetrahydrofolate ligase [Bacillota bacterium]